MFGNNKKSKPIKSAKVDTLVGPGTVIDGDLVFTGGLHVEGQIKGNVRSKSDDEHAILILNENGLIEGDVHVPIIIVNGIIKGDLYSSSRAELAEDAKIHGTVYYNLLEMSVGAEINGSLVHESKAKVDKPLPKLTAKTTSNID